jgi:hypothetical protein
VGKRKPRLSDQRLRDIWNVRTLDYADGELEHFDKLIASAVSRCLAENEADRAGLAADLSCLLGQEVSVAMMNAYTSEARREHPIPAYRFLALIAMTRRFDILDAVVREVGGKALDYSDAQVFKLGKSYLANIHSSRQLQATVTEVLATDSTSRLEGEG